MRSIPFRIVCVLGMNDADYPRRASQRDFDLMTTSFRPGDRSRREDDRYLFLEALLSARDKFYLSWQGNRATDNVDMPPSVVVSQLLEDIERRLDPPIKAQSQPLQPFSMAYFTKPADGEPCFVTV
jgi:exodeoxyribonuclease V gamma subunit